MKKLRKLLCIVLALLFLLIPCVNSGSLRLTKSLEGAIAPEDKEPITDYDYSMVVVGDTQILARYYQEEFTGLYDWILENKDEKKIKFVMGMGDITDTSTEAEFNLAIENFNRLRGVIPFSFVRGNHDRINEFNQYFPYEDYKDMIDGAYIEGLMENTYQLLHVGEMKYLILSLDFAPTDNALAWASDVCEQHPDYNVIVTTHGYLSGYGELIDSYDEMYSPAGDNLGVDMWNEFVSKHENIVMVLCGHVSGQRNEIIRRTDVGDNGNSVLQMVVNPQSVDYFQEPTGLVAILYFSNEGKTIDVEYYATATDQFFGAENQFRVNIETVASNKANQDTEHNYIANTDIG